MTGVNGAVAYVRWSAGEFVMDLGYADDHVELIDTRAAITINGGVGDDISASPLGDPGMGQDRLQPA